MQLVVNIPDEFVAHYKMDKFEDSLKRIETDISIVQDNDDGISGNYENELLDMLITSFSNSEVFIDEKKRKESFKTLIDLCGDERKRLLNCYNIFSNSDCNITSVKNYLLTDFRLGLIDSATFGRLYFVFLFSLFLDSDEIIELVSDSKNRKD